MGAIERGCTLIERINADSQDILLFFKPTLVARVHLGSVVQIREDRPNRRLSVFYSCSRLKCHEFYFWLFARAVRQRVANTPISELALHFR